MTTASSKRRRVLMIDDDSSLTELVREFLGLHEFDFAEAHDAASGLLALKEFQPQLILLDIMLPGKNGLELCRDMRQISEVPILMLTARGDWQDRVLGLELGADDYLAKPFEPGELLARCRAILRRGPRLAEASNCLQFDDLTVDLDRRSAALAGQNIAMTTAEFELLSLFISHPNEALNRDQMSLRLRGTEWEALSRSVDVVMSRLRQKLNDDPKNPRFFKTIWGTGYMFIGKAVWS